MKKLGVNLMVILLTFLSSNNLSSQTIQHSLMAQNNFDYAIPSIVLNPSYSDTSKHQLSLWIVDQFQLRSLNLIYLGYSWSQAKASHCFMANYQGNHYYNQSSLHYKLSINLNKDWKIGILPNLTSTKTFGHETNYKLNGGMGSSFRFSNQFQLSCSMLYFNNIQSTYYLSLRWNASNTVIIHGSTLFEKELFLFFKLNYQLKKVALFVSLSNSPTPFGLGIRLPLGKSIHHFTSNIHPQLGLQNNISSVYQW